MSWREVLALAESLALRLGGLTVVGSYALHLYAESKGIPDAVYAAYWGVDRSERNPFYARLGAAGHEPCWSIVASATWAEVLDPSLASLATFTESARLLAEPPRIPPWLSRIAPCGAFSVDAPQLAPWLAERRPGGLAQHPSASRFRSGNPRGPIDGTVRPM